MVEIPVHLEGRELALRYGLDGVDGELGDGAVSPCHVDTVTGREILQRIEDPGAEYPGIDVGENDGRANGARRWRAGVPAGFGIGVVQGRNLDGSIGIEPQV